MGVEVTPRTTGGTFPLYERFPQLTTRVPRIALSTGPSPVSLLANLSRDLRTGVWLKNDGLYGTVYGGNKARKLEFVIADALGRHATTVVTTGGIGTNHGLASALYCREAGIDTVLILTYEEPTAEARQNLLLMADSGAQIHYARSYLKAAFAAPYIVAHCWRRDRRFPYLVGPGASSPLANLGYVNAAFELAGQVKAGLIPEPGTIILPLGTGGTVAGLLVGLRLAGLDSKVLAVSITRAPTAWQTAVSRLARSTARLLARTTGDRDLARVRLDGLSVTREWLGPGFGRASERGDRAHKRLADSEGLELDPVYTAKAMAALLDTAETGALSSPVLFWHTQNAIVLPTPGANAVSRVPNSLRRVCGL
jgi:D-cysteine desulfhydrase